MDGGWTLQPVEGDPFAQKQSAAPTWNLQPVEGDPFSKAPTGNANAPEFSISPSDLPDKMPSGSAEPGTRLRPPVTPTPSMPQGLTEYGLPATTPGIARQTPAPVPSAPTTGPPLEAGEATPPGTALAVPPPPKTTPEILDHVAAIAPGAIGRIASAVAQAAREGYQGGELLDPQSQKTLSDAAARGGITGYLATLVSTAAHDLSYSTAQIPALVHGAQAGLQQFGEETGNQQFARDIAALPEAFPLLGAELGLHGYVPPAAQEAVEPSNIYEAMQQRANETPAQRAGREFRDQAEAEWTQREQDIAEWERRQTSSGQARIAGPTAEVAPAPKSTPTQPTPDLARTELERANVPAVPEVAPVWNLEPVEGDPFGAPTPVDEAAAQAVEPTPAQAEAGNYQKGHVTIGGLPIAIETPKDGIRSGVGPDGTPWQVTMPAHYGYVNRTIAADNDHLDVSLGPLAHEAPSHPVFVVDQIDPQTGMFDEHKGFLGFPTAQAAVAAYDGSFSDGSGPTRRGAVTQMPFDQFKVWATKGDLSKPLAALKPQTGATPYTAEPKEPMRLVKFLQQPVVSFAGTPHETRIPGGLIDTGGDVSAIVGGPRGRPGLLNSNGQQLDAATQRAWQAGYLPGDQRPEINDLLAAIREDHEGRPVYSAHDQDEAQAYQYAKAHNSEIDRLANDHGLPTRGLTREQFFDQLANHVSLADAARLHDEAMAGHQDAFDQAVASARANGIDPDAYTPRSLQEMEDEHRQADAATAEGPVSGDDGGRPVAGRDPRAGEVSAGQSGRGVVDAGRAGPQTGGQSALEAAREELPGEGLFENRAPLFSPTARAVDNLKQMRGTGEQMLAQITKTPGVKPEELNWMNLPGWLRGQKSVTKEQIADYVRANQLDVREVTRQESDPKEYAKVRQEVEALGIKWDDANINQLVAEHASSDLIDRFGRYVIGNGQEPKYGSYRLPGGSGGYREMLITLPQKISAIPSLDERAQKMFGRNYDELPGGRQAEVLNANRQQMHEDASGQYHTNHWDEPNILAHIRFDERTGADGKRVLMVHEAQSDWHQKGRKEGYQNDERRELPEEMRLRPVKRSMGWVVEDGRGIRENNAFYDSEVEAAEAAADFNHMVAEDYNGPNRVPNAPFKTSWPSLVMKRVLKLAADNGFDRVAWSPGEVHADRYDLSKHISRVALHDNASGGIGRPRMEGPFTTGYLEAYDHNGRKVIDKYITDPKELPDLIGKEAADKLLAVEPKEARSAGLGVRVHSLSGLDLKLGGEGMKGFYDKILPSETNKIVGKFGAKVGKSRLQEKSPSIANDGPQHANALGVTEVHSVDITPAMRATIQSQGLGLFAGRRLPTPPQAGEDLFGATRAQPAARTPEPTIRNDQRQADMFGTKDAAVQAQAARDQAGRGALAPKAPQQRVDEGLFKAPEPHQSDLNEMIETVRRGVAEKNQLSDELAAAGKPVKMVRSGGLTAIVSPDLGNPGSWRITRFDEHGPIGHTEFRDAKTAFFNALQERFVPARPESRISRWPNSENFQDRLAEIQQAGHETAADWTLERGRNTGHEHIAVVDNRTGEIVHAGTNGLAGEVRFRGDNGAYDHKPDSLTIHHNHPNGTALSSPDLAMLANPAVSHVVSHGHDGTTTIASLTPEMAGHRGAWGGSEQQIGRNGLAIRTASNAALPLAEQILVPLARAGKITPEQANHLYQDIANRLLAAQGAIHYTSTVELPSVVQVALGKTLEGLGHASENHDRYTGAVQPEDRIASLPAPESGPQGAGGPGRGSAGQGVSQPEQAELGRGEGKLLEGDQRSVQRGLNAESGSGGDSRNPPEPPMPPAHGGGDGLESGRRLPLSPIGTSGDVLRDMKGIRRAAAEVKAALSPTSLRGAKPTEQLIRAHGGTQARSYAQAVHALEQVRNAVDKLPRDEQEEFTYKMETGARQPTPELQVVADTLRHLIDGWANAVRGLGRGYLENARQDYMGHIWGNYHEWSNGLPPPTEKEMEANANAAKQAKTPLRGSGAFLKQRTFDTQREGINAGLVPVTYNPVDLQLIKMREIQKFYHGTKLADQMKAAGIARWVPAGAEGEARDQGLVKLDDSVFQPRIRPGSSGTGHNQGPSFGVLEAGNWYAPESAARLFNHYMSRGLSGQSIIYDTFRGANNALNSLQLGLSGFHATFVALDTAISRVALGLQQLSEGKIAKGAGNVLFGWTPATVVRTLNRGRQLGNAFLDPANSTPEMQQIANDMATAGGRMNMDQFYQTTGAGTFFRHLGDLKHPLSPFHQAAQMFKDEPSAIKKAALVPLRIAGRVIDTINHPLMGVMVPAAKRGVFADMAQNWNESHPNATTEERSAAMIKMWDSVDNRMGQLVYDNVFWHKAQKDVAFVLTRSVGWNLGTLREIGGTGPDGVKFLNDAAHGRRPEFTTRMAYTMAMPIVTAIYGAILTYLATGHGPRSLMDYFFPPSGNQDAKGEPQRRVIPGYIKDVIEYSKAPVQTILNKTSPLVETMAEVHNNRDYYGGTIYDPNRDSMLPAYGDYLLNQALPFSWRGWNKLEQQKAPPLDQALAFWGIQPAPAAITSPERGAAYQARSNYLGDIKRAREPNRLHILTPGPRAVAPPP